MNRSVLSWQQAVGLEPISREEFFVAIDEGIADAERGDTIPLDDAYADFRRSCEKRHIRSSAYQPS